MVMSHKDVDVAGNRKVKKDTVPLVDGNNVHGL